MPHPILMPKPGQMTEECTLILWRKAEGDAVHKGDVLFEIETDKSAMEVETWDEGTLLRQVVAEGQTVPVNAVCAWVGRPGEAIPEVDTTFPPAPDAQSCRLAPARPAQRLATWRRRWSSPSTPSRRWHQRPLVPTSGCASARGRADSPPRPASIRGASRDPAPTAASPSVTSKR